MTYSEEKKLQLDKTVPSKLKVEDIIFYVHIVFLRNCFILDKMPNAPLMRNIPDIKNPVLKNCFNLTIK